MDFLGFFFFMDLFFWSIIFQKTVYEIIFSSLSQSQVVTEFIKSPPPLF